MTEINWAEAPDWAQWHAFDKRGAGYYYQYVPSQGDNIWIAADWNRIRPSGHTF